MKTPRPPSSRVPFRLATRFRFCAFFFLAATGFAQTGRAPAGTVTGRVLNTATNEYARNAEIRLQGTNLTATTEDGRYRQMERYGSQWSAGVKGDF